MIYKTKNINDISEILNKCTNCSKNKNLFKITADCIKLGCGKKQCEYHKSEVW